MSSDDPLPVRSISCFVSLNSRHCRARRRKTGLVGCYRHATKDGNTREEGKNTARWIYIGVYHNCLSQISFICFCLWKLLL